MQRNMQRLKGVIVQRKCYKPTGHVRKMTVALCVAPRCTISVMCYKPTGHVRKMTVALCVAQLNAKTVALTNYATLCNAICNGP